MEILSDLKEKIKTSFPEGADVNYEVKYITKALQDYASPAMYFTPQIDNNASTQYISTPEAPALQIFIQHLHMKDFRDTCIRLHILQTKILI